MFRPEKTQKREREREIEDLQTERGEKKTAYKTFLREMMLLGLGYIKLVGFVDYHISWIQRYGSLNRTTRFYSTH